MLASIDPERAVVPIVYASLAILLQYAVAALSLPLVARPGARGRMLIAAASLSLAMTPLVIPPHARLLRFLAALWAGTLGTKLYDLRLDVLRGNTPGFGPSLVFLVHPFTQVRRKLPLERRPSRHADLLRLAAAACLLLVGLAIGRYVFRLDWSGVPFLAEHAAKLVAFYVPTLSALAVGSSSWRLLGGRARDHMDHPYLARTPADFWRRYNRNMQQFFLEDVFIPMGGRHRPCAGILSVFALSGLLHEIIFGVASGRVPGFQMAFFLIQGLAVAATARVKPSGWRAIVWTACTQVFVVITCPLFFASLQGVVPYYSRRSGGP
jgi:hypothetical protein